MIKLDGSYLEGGGQIVRTALALSTLTGKPFVVDKIRSGRKQSGLKAQHLYGIKALEKLCNAKTKYAELGSDKLEYIPGKIGGKTISIDIGTAGSITLLLQSLLIPAIFSGKKTRVTIKGGTDVKWSMPIDYLNDVFLPIVRRYADIELKLKKRGYYPKGGGLVDIFIKSRYDINDFEDFKDFLKYLRENEKEIDLVGRGNIVYIKGVSNAAKELEKSRVSERQAMSAKHVLSKFGVPIKIRTEYGDSLSIGSVITLLAIFDNNEKTIIGADSLGEKGKKAEIVGKEAAETLMKEIESNAAVDKNMADNLIPFLGLIKGRIKTSEITMHTKSNIYVVEKFLGEKFSIKNKTIEL